MKSTNRLSQLSDLEFSKWLVVINGGVPLALLAWDAWQGELGANPINFAIRTTGLLALIFLCLSLLITPVRVFTGFNWLISFRRSLGLYAFFYACAHFTIFFVWDRELSIFSTIHEIFTRLYLVIGTLALVLMMPLAVTSTNQMVRRLGIKRWQLLHQLAYLSIMAGAVHFYMQAKSDKRLPTAFAIAVAILLAYRFVAHYVKLWMGAASGPKAQPLTPPTAGLDSIGRKPKFWTGQLRVARRFEETSSVRTFRLVATDGVELPFNYIAGQYLNLSVMIDGKKVNRSYTIASSPTRGGYCELTVKREGTGVTSRHLHDVLKEGELLSISAPAGRFTFTGGEADSIVLIGAGVGITPLMSVIRYLTDRCWGGEIFLIYAVKTQADIIFQEELAILGQRFPNLHVKLVLSQEPNSDWTGQRGRITRDLLTETVPQISRRLVHVCGPLEMMVHVTAMLRELGVPEDRIKSEAFQSGGQMMTETVTAPNAAATPVATEPPPAAGNDIDSESNTDTTITFSLTGKTTPISRATTVLEAAEEAGVNIDFECRSGICGTCKTKLLAGRVDMEIHDALTPADRANNLILACQAKPLEALTVSA